MFLAWPAGEAASSGRPRHRVGSSTRCAPWPVSPTVLGVEYLRSVAERSDPMGDPDIGEVDVCILGPVEVRGAARPFTRAWTVDLVVYLALHRFGVSNEQWATALWPDRLMAAPTLHSTVSAARRALGRSGGGTDHLPRQRGSLRLGPTVSTDWRRFQRLADSTDPRDWRTGRSIVRGRPFAGLRSFDWPVLEGIEAEVTETVVHLAVRLADHLLARGDGRRAAQVARKGLVACPFDERLYRLILRAADAEGNPAGVEAAMSELLGLVSRDPGGSTPGALAIADEDCALVHPDTAALYWALSRRLPAASGGSFARL